MITIGIILIIVSLLFIIAGIVISMEDIGGIMVIIFGLVITIEGILIIDDAITNLENKSKPKVYKIDLPEEISLAKTNDILYINKITKDSIYLGFKPNK